MDASTLTLNGLLARKRSDRELLADAMAADSLAFAEVYRRYSGRIQGFCLSKLGDAEAATDAMQEVFIRVLRSGATDIENPSAWLYSIARSVIVDSIRASARRPHDSVANEDLESVALSEP